MNSLTSCFCVKLDSTLVLLVLEGLIALVLLSFSCGVSCCFYHSYVYILRVDHVYFLFLKALVKIDKNSVDDDLN